MKIVTSVFFLFLVFPLVLMAQLRNPDFDNWTNGEPDEWLSNNTAPDYIGITQTSDNFTPPFAVHGQVFPLFTISFAPTLVAGSDGRGFPSGNPRPTSLEGYYKFTSVNNDMFLISVLATKNSDLVGGASLTLTSADSYIRFSAGIIYFTDDDPDTTIISFSIINSGGLANAGSEFYLDNLSWSTTTDVGNYDDNILDRFNLEQNYPNPFNPSTKIKYSIAPPNLPKGEASVGTSFMKFVTLKVYNILGNEVATLVSEEKPAGIYEVNFDGSKLQSGIYFYRLQAGSFSETRKLVLLK